MLSLVVLVIEPKFIFAVDCPRKRGDNRENYDVLTTRCRLIKLTNADVAQGQIASLTSICRERKKKREWNDEINYSSEYSTKHKASFWMILFDFPLANPFFETIREGMSCSIPPFLERTFILGDIATRIGKQFRYSRRNRANSLQIPFSVCCT